MSSRRWARLLGAAMIILGLTGVAVWWVYAFIHVWPFMEGSATYKAVTPPGAIPNGYHSNMLPTELSCQYLNLGSVVATPQGTVITLTSLFIASLLSTLAGIAITIASFVPQPTQAPPG
ncbi:hypothetical protein ACIRCZ_18745 [Leifsonia sp. NPDC102414]|uniref:hypothetical protein n=1 Tax=Leifsonia sp. NPDC102414 TaxID=3364124 RepID=UPI00381DF779